MTQVLLDAGPMVAFLDRRDPHHKACLRVFERERRAQYVTTWPVITEAVYFLGKHIGIVAQEALWDLLEAVRIASIDAPEDRERLRALMRKYSDHPMDLADASLVRVAERDNVRTIFTVDHDDFSSYRIARRAPAKPATFRILP